jgi:sarcosine oxidase subunit gamma
MAEVAHRLSRRSPLGDVTAGPIAGIAPAILSIRLLPSRAHFSLRLDVSRLPAGGQVAGFMLGVPINRSALDARTASRLGPDEWLLCGPAAEAARMAGELEAALAGQHFSLVDVGHRFVALAVSGTRAADVLNSGCPLDLSRAAFPTRSVTRTLLGKCEVILGRTDDAPTFEAACGRSFAAYAYDFLLQAARELRSQA